MAKLTLEAEMPAKLLQEFLQAMRNAECKHFDEIVLAVWIDAPECKTGEAERIFRSITPPYSQTQTVRFKS